MSDEPWTSTKHGHFETANESAAQYAEWLEKERADKARLAATVERVREYVHVADAVDTTDWQRGYRAAANRALAALNAEREGNLAPPMDAVTTEIDMQRQIWLLGRELHLATCIGNAPPALKRLGDRMRHPRPGDLVVHIDGLAGYDPDGVGILLRVECRSDHRFVDRWVIEPLHRPGEEQGWSNAEFVAVPTERARRWVETTEDHSDGR